MLGRREHSVARSRWQRLCGVSRLSAPALRAAGCIKSPVGWHCARLSPCPHPSGPLAVNILLPAPGPRHLCRHGVPLLLRLPARRWPCPPRADAAGMGRRVKDAAFRQMSPGSVPRGCSPPARSKDALSHAGTPRCPTDPAGEGWSSSSGPGHGKPRSGSAGVTYSSKAAVGMLCSASLARGAPLLQGPAVGRRCRALGAAASGCRGAGAGLSRAVPGRAVSSTPHRAAIVPSQRWPCLAPACPASLGRGLGSAMAAAAKGLGRSHAAAQRVARGGTEMCWKAGCWCTLCLACSPSPSRQSAL